jgi:hypothetical protein
MVVDSEEVGVGEYVLVDLMYRDSSYDVHSRPPEAVCVQSAL